MALLEDGQAKPFEDRLSDAAYVPGGEEEDEEEEGSNGFFGAEAEEVDERGVVVEWWPGRRARRLEGRRFAEWELVGQSFRPYE